jgi:isoleucyl-tRNA synthetase
VFDQLPSVPDHARLELDILDFWEKRGIFEKLRAQNAEGPRWSFFDGPVTANKTLGVHTAWGRTLKDVFQRYKALRGFHQRYQNGFDCQGLWIEVGVERELGLNSKREIEEYGLAEFTRRCREKVAWSADELTRGSKRLGQWMDWGADYFTFSDTNIEYIWRFLKHMHEQGWLSKGHRSTEWCPRCGTSISQHELIGHYFDKTDPSLFARFPLLERPGESLAVWTTTPWTLPANVAAAVKPDAEYGRRENGEWVAVARYPDEVFADRKPGAALVGLRYEGPFDHLPAAAGIEHRVIPWEDVSLEEGTGIVHIAPGCGAEDFELSRVHDLPVLGPVDEAGRFCADYGWLHGQGTVEAAEQIVADLSERGRLISADEIVHRFPFCWRCHTPLIFRLSDDWFLAVEELRPRLLAANATVEWTPAYMSKRMDDWLRNMGDWNISRRRFFGLPLPFYPCVCGHLNVIGSRAELEARATGGLEQLEELHRPWIDEVPISCEQCGSEVRRIPEVGDVWLDAGIIPFSTLGWQNSEWIPQGYATGSARGVTTADLPDHAYWEQWFPADWVSEMREQIRLWFYSQLFMSVALVDRSPFRSVLGYEKMLDEHGREMHGSWGNLIAAEEAFERMGADVMRWQYCQQPPDRNLLFGYGPAHEIKRRLLTLWNSVSFFVTYGSIEAFEPTLADLAEGPVDAPLRPLDRWLLARTQVFLEQATDGYESFLTGTVTRAFESFVDDVSNWYIRRSRRRFWDESDEAAFRTLWYALAQALRAVSPIMPFLAEHLWQTLVARPVADAPESVFLAGWPAPNAALADAALVAEMAEARRVIELGHSARHGAQLKLRQPLRRVAVVVDDPARREMVARHVDELGGELNVKEVHFPIDAGELATSTAKPRLDLLGPRLGSDLPELRRLLAAGSFEIEDGALRAGGFELAPGEYTLEFAGNEGWAVAHDAPYVVAVDTDVDDELRLEGRALDLIHTIQRLRKDSGLAITDRIVIRYDGDHEEVVAAHGDRIARETLAVRIERHDGEPLAIEKA